MTNQRYSQFEDDDWERGRTTNRNSQHSYDDFRTTRDLLTASDRGSGQSRTRNSSRRSRPSTADHAARPHSRSSSRKRNNGLKPLGILLIVLILAAVITGVFFVVRGISHAVHKYDMMDVTDALVLTSFTLAEGIGLSEDDMTIQPLIPPKRVDLPLIVFDNPAAKNKVCLTFDDGPVPGYTEQYLEILEQYDVPAAFFSLGILVNTYPELANQIVESGNELCSHSLQHDVLNQLSEDALVNDFSKTDEIFRSVTGRRPKFMRPPYGEYNDSVLNMARSYRMQTVYWSIDTNDWRGYDADTLVSTIVNNLHAGAIILCHEGKQNTLAALPQIIESVEAAGYEFVSMEELLSNYDEDA